MFEEHQKKAEEEQGYIHMPRVQQLLQLLCKTLYNPRAFPVSWHLHQRHQKTYEAFVHLVESTCETPV